MSDFLAASGSSLRSTKPWDSASLASKSGLIAVTYETLALSLQESIRAQAQNKAVAPRERLSGFFRASFAPEIIDPQLFNVWLVFWSMVAHSPEMRAVQPHTNIFIEERSAAPALNTAADAEVTQFAAALSGGNATIKVPFGTEGGLFSAAGIPTIICGPGSIDQAHKPDEFVALDQIARCERFLQRLIDRVSQQ